jgi:hypothetical protein
VGDRTDGIDQRFAENRILIASGLNQGGCRWRSRAPAWARCVLCFWVVHTQARAPPGHQSRTTGGSRAQDQRRPRWIKRMEADYNVRMRVSEPAITVRSKALVKLNKHRKNTMAWDVVISYTKCPSLLTWTCNQIS